jgi:nicotinate-nucleotide pyrophosphorylase (carboxylating)
MQTTEIPVYEDPEFGLSLDEIIRLALEEDVGSGDITTGATVEEGVRAAARIVAKEDCVVCGLGIVRRTFEIVDPAVEADLHAEDGSHVEAGTHVATIRGPARALLTGERAALNFLQRLSGIATLTRVYVDKVRGTGAQILDTRKTPPLLRRLSKYAVRCGGGTNHRHGLHDAVLIKDNHIRAAGGIEPALARVREAYGDQYTVEIEVEDLDQLEAALHAGAKFVMLDNMSPDQIREARRRFGSDFVIEASGGVDLETAAEYAEAGANYISVGAITHSAPCIDFSMEIVETGRA